MSKIIVPSGLAVTRNAITNAEVAGAEAGTYLAEDMQDLLTLYAQLTPRDKKKFFAMGQVLLD